eukprot:scaffold191142_cov30-Prasinocladus_malaysianus.AAC.2
MQDSAPSFASAAACRHLFRSALLETNFARLKQEMAATPARINAQGLVSTTPTEHAAKIVRHVSAYIYGNIRCSYPPMKTIMNNTLKGTIKLVISELRPVNRVPLHNQDYEARAR